MAQVSVPTAPRASRTVARRPARSAVRHRDGWGAFLVSMTARGALLLLVGLLLWSVVPAAVGWSSSVVMSNSMAPRLFAGDVILIRPVLPEELAIGQILLVDDPDEEGRLRMHRLTAVDEETGELTLKGDANERADSTTVRPDAVHGVAALRVPWVGSPLVWFHEGRIRLVAGTAAALAALAAAAWLYRPSTGGAPVDTVAPPTRPARRRRRGSTTLGREEATGSQSFRGMYHRTDTCPFAPVAAQPEHELPGRPDVPSPAAAAR